ncbi:sphingosine-1-phosphate lyase-like [Panulirus ornatus]|uniref:sphingosine-1-phosphate lyase-like n=1 Tax=Panulirus ornatus TaxID=150431 RepID=UPI003A866BD0
MEEVKRSDVISGARIYLATIYPTCIRTQWLLRPRTVQSVGARTSRNILRVVYGPCPWSWSTASGVRAVSVVVVYSEWCTGRVRGRGLQRSVSAAVAMMDHLLKWLEQKAASFEGWQVVAVTVATTLATLTITDLCWNWQDKWEKARHWVLTKLRDIPGVHNYVDSEIEEYCSVMEELEKTGGEGTLGTLQETLPPAGYSRDQVLAAAAAILTYDKYNWKEGKMSEGDFPDSDQAYNKLLEHTYGLFAFSNPLHADVFPGVRKMEAEVVRMIISLYHGSEEHAGCITSGGPESILMVLKAMRDWGRAVKGTKRPEIVTCITAHAAFDNAASMVGVKIRKVPMDPKTCKVNLEAMRRAITSNTVLLVASAPQFAHGMMDDVEAVGALGLRYNVPVHVDCCLAGFLLPFMDAAGYPLPPFDFRVPGVTSISVDTDKVRPNVTSSSQDEVTWSHMVLSKVLRPHPHYVCQATSQCGSQATSSLCLSGHIPICVSGNFFGKRHTFCLHLYSPLINSCPLFLLQARLKTITAIELFGDPLTSILAFKSDDVDILKVGGILVEHGWNINIIQHPPGLRICLTSQQLADDFADRFVADLKKAIKEIQVSPGAKIGIEKVHGSVAGMLDKAMVRDTTKIFLSRCYEAEPTEDDQPTNETENMAAEETTKGI